MREHRFARSHLRDAVTDFARIMGASGRPALFDELDDDDIEEVFEDLTALSLEPSRHLMSFYRHFNPMDVQITPWVYRDLELVHLRDLTEVHESFTWSDKRRARECWRGRWIVIAHTQDDPYFVDASKPELPLYTDTHGFGAWRPRLVASSLSGFFRLCAGWCEHFVSSGIDPSIANHRDRRSSLDERKAFQTWERFLKTVRDLDRPAYESGFWAPDVQP